MTLTLADFMEKVSNIIINSETSRAKARNREREEELEGLQSELVSQEEEIAYLQSLVNEAEKTLQDAEKAGPNGIKDPFDVLKTWAIKHGAWNGWEYEVNGRRSLPTLGWVRRSKNLNVVEFSQYERMYDIAKRGRAVVFKGYIENLKSECRKAQENLTEAQVSYNFDKNKYERLKKQVKEFKKELEKIREEATPKTKEDLKNLLEDAWEEEEEKGKILKLLPEEDYVETVEVKFNSIVKFHTIHLADATVNFETYA